MPLHHTGKIIVKGLGQIQSKYIEPALTKFENTVTLGQGPHPERIMKKINTEYNNSKVQKAIQKASTAQQKASAAQDKALHKQQVDQFFEDRSNKEKILEIISVGALNFHQNIFSKWNT